MRLDDFVTECRECHAPRGVWVRRRLDDDRQWVLAGKGAASIPTSEMGHMVKVCLMSDGRCRRCFYRSNKKGP
jgi:hypothetical protein